MEFSSPLTQAVLLKRYKRFLAEVVVNNEENRLIYCPNQGMMRGCEILGSRIWFSHTFNPQRRFPDTWELIEVDAGYLVCINTQHPLPLLIEGIQNGVIQPLQGYARLQLAPPPLDEHHFDMCLEKEASDEKCWVALNHVTLGDEIHRGFFPDAITEKGVQQLRALIHAKQLGHRAILFYAVLHSGIERIFPADHIDIQYGYALRQAMIAGVEVMAYRVGISLEEISFVKPVEVCIPARMICSSRL